MEERTKSIGVLVKAAEVLRILGNSDDALGPSEIARATGLDRSAVHRILMTLTRERLVARAGDNGTYRIGPDLMALGLVAANRLDLRRAARPHLETLYARVTETVNLSILDHDAALCIDMIEARHGLRMAASVGTRDSLTASSLGKVLLAFLPAPRRAALPAVLPLTAATPHSIRDRNALERDLAAVRERGYALDNEENEIGVSCVGAPIFGVDGDAVGAVSASLPTVRFTAERRPEIIAAVVAAASRISRELGPSTSYRGSSNGDGGGEPAGLAASSDRQRQISDPQAASGRFAGTAAGGGSDRGR